mgnify:FL=1
MNAQEKHERNLAEMDRDHREFAACAYKATREHLGTQAEVAAMLGVNRVTVAKRESGTMTITNEAVLAIQSLRRPRRKRGRVVSLQRCRNLS